jgi:hypothetical protein
VQKPKPQYLKAARRSAVPRSPRLWKWALGIVCAFTALPLAGSGKDGIQWGGGLIINVPFPESEVAQVVADVAQNGIIRGTKEYNKDEYIAGATAVSSTRVFPEKVEGKVFYKVRLQALDPRNFKNSGDMGTLAVRYVLQPQGDRNTVLRIDARFVEDFRRISHASNGSVEGAEYKDIHDRLESLQLVKAETVEAATQKQGQGAKTVSDTTSGSSSSAPAVAAPSGQTAVAALEPPGGRLQDAAQTTPAQTGPVQTLEQRVQDLRRQVERIVKSPGAPLKSAPFNTASTLQTLPAGTEVLIVVSTTYWLGIETHEGQHGWMLRDELESLP